MRELVSFRISPGTTCNAGDDAPAIGGASAAPGRGRGGTSERSFSGGGVSNGADGTVSTVRQPPGPGSKR